MEDEDVADVDSPRSGGQSNKGGSRLSLDRRQRAMESTKKVRPLQNFKLDGGPFEIIHPSCEMDLPSRASSLTRESKARNG